MLYFRPLLLLLKVLHIALCSICTDGCCRGCGHSGWEGLESVDSVPGPGRIGFSGSVVVRTTPEGGWRSSLCDAWRCPKYLMFPDDAWKAG